MSKQKSFLRFTLFLVLAVMVVILFPIASVRAEGRTRLTIRSAYSRHETEDSVGTTKLLRNRLGLTAVFETTRLPPDQTIGVWFIFFNDPTQCSTRPCSLPDDLLDPNVSSDLHFVEGQVINIRGGKTAFAGHLKVDDPSGSGLTLIDQKEAALTAPYGAEVWLALQSHEPTLTGQDLQNQIKTYLHDCQVYLGLGAPTADPTDPTDEEGVCSTLQFSLHKGIDG
jgi:hypothetical protein